MATLRAWSLSLGPAFPVVFFALYVAITQFPIPRTILTLSSGVLFGPVVGCAVALTATTVSAALALTWVRAVVGERIAARLTHPAVATINARLRARGWLAVASLRMIAAVPFSVLNYTAALTQVRLLPFALATLVGSAPGTIATVFLGDALVTRPSPAMMLVTVGLFCLGMAGLALDAKLPVRSRPHED
ncbi:TVP38/TMEM64 family protein [Corynebacterium sp. 13CS0277]|nr:TVP38/TMEM64 family protein [Corynebacterium sp. 13CS0277]